MRELLLNLTTSLDGFIADASEGFDWILPPPDPAELPADYLELMDSVDALVMGRATYELSLRLSGGMDMFEGKGVFVFTSREDLPSSPGVQFVHTDAAAFVGQLKAQEGGTIWLYGGGQLATALAEAGLIDDFLIVVQPVLLGAGIRLWQEGLSTLPLELQYCREWPDGLVELRYRAKDAMWTGMHHVMTDEETRRA